MSGLLRLAPSPHEHKSLSYSRSIARPGLISVVKLFVLALWNLPLLLAAPATVTPFNEVKRKTVSSAQGTTLWINLAVAVGLVLLGGAFAGLTIALMGQVRAQTSASSTAERRG